MSSNTIYTPVKCLSDFIHKANLVHDNKYDYTTSVYIDTRTNLNIICKKCNEVISVAPAYHLIGGGKCRRCVYKIRTKDDWISEFNKIYNNFYDYSQIDYTKTTEFINIICPKHGLFKQKPHGHLKHPCLKCSIELRRKNTEQFVIDARKVHGDTFNYDLVKYETNTSVITIICKIHGKFTQTATGHLQGWGCNLCRPINIRKDTEYFIKKAKEIHGDLYDYSLVNYNKRSDNVKLYVKFMASLNKELAIT